MSKLADLPFDEIYTTYKQSHLSSLSLKKIPDSRIRAAVYECLILFPEKIMSSGLIEELSKILPNMHDKREKNYLIEKKTFIKIKELFNLANGPRWDYLYYKISYIISRRLFLVYNNNAECEQDGEVELSILLQQINLDITSYLNTLKISYEKNINIDELHLKSLILRALKTLVDLNGGLALDLKTIEGKTVYFIKSSYNVDMAFHMHAKVFLHPPLLSMWGDIALNGGFHYLNKRRLVEPNIYNNYSLSAQALEKVTNFIRNQNNLGFYIDKEMLDLEREAVIRKLGEDREINKEWGSYFSSIEDLSLEELNSIINLEYYKKKRRKNQYLREINNFEELEKTREKLKTYEKKKNIDIKKIDRLRRKEGHLLGLIEKNIFKWDPKMYNKWLQKDFSHVFILKIYLDFVDFFKDYDEALYFSLYFDFRGRFYFNSMVAPSQGWPFRFLYNFGELGDEVDDYESIISLEAYLPIIEAVEARIGLLNKAQKKSLLWVLLSIGSLTIEKKEIILEREFIEEGLKNYLGRLKVNGYLENSELTYYYLIIDNFNRDKKDRYLLKDISGSIFQNASLILGIQDETKLKYLNLDGNVWYDPYAIIINKIRNGVPEHLKKFFTRKTLKKPIMTRYYNAKLFTSFKYFIKEASKIQDYNDSLFKDLWLEFKKIYDTLKNLEKELIFCHSNEDYNNFLKDKKIDKIDYESFNFSIIAYKLKPCRIDIVVSGKRMTVTIYKQTNKRHLQKINNSMIPNIFHGEDSQRARLLISSFNEKCFCIHDAFGASYTKINKLIIKANLSFNINQKRKFYMNSNKVEKKIFSKFIIL